MAMKVFCKFENKQVNTEYYDCPNRFKNCKECPKRKWSSKIHRPISLIKQNRLSSDKEQKRDLFSDWNVYPIHCWWGRDPETNQLKPDFVIGLEDSVILDYLIYNFEKEASGDQAKGMGKFWWHVERLFEWKQGGWKYLTQEEKDILRAAKDGSTEAIQKLVIANPKMIRIPFVAKVLEDLIRTVKFRNGKEFQKAKKLWLGFLPKRENHKHIIKDEYLIKALRNIMEVKGCTKEKAAKILHRDDPSLSEERLRKISVGIVHKKIKQIG
jgi:hypothetical protein